jgi:hypothetical protein
MKITYDSNNSGGSWWLSDENWRALEAGGWTVHWAKDNQYQSRYMEGGRYMDALATSASVDRPSLGMAIAEWEHLTGLDASEPGCSCCGAPHGFYASDGAA